MKQLDHVDWVKPDHELHCERCGAPLSEESAVWLELHSLTGEWAREGTTDWGPESQGAFPFGPWCAKVQLAKRTLRPRSTRRRPRP